ncbi:MAG: 16S rRNA (cytosine(1402)-N(4))-methyltransferase RsmH [Bacteroidales bacterium]|nr:16S rRNA (cytosine(1402)-N(4))-methyltransferase RsmH [Bacteroidales bacterium]
MSEYHTPVLLTESVSALVTNPSGLYADATFGGGGHTAGVLSRLHEDGFVIAFDRDIQALDNKIDDPRLILIHNNFRFIHNYGVLAWRKGLAALSAGEQLTAGAGVASGRPSGSFAETREYALSPEGLPEAEGQPAQEAEGAVFDGILADLGVSSHQFDTAERGFSFRFDAPLDMRMNTEAGKTAADIVNTYGEAELERILRLYAEVDNPRKAARLIVSAREQEPIRTTGQLDKALAPILPKMAEHKVLAKVYQGLRIEVNQEMHSLEKFLEGAAASLKPGGRLVVITYHSLEDRMVKNFIKTGNVEGREEKDLYGRTHAPLQTVNRKPILPSEEEIARNTRARSAKLRIAEKI